jgi:hypothetical protein
MARGFGATRGSASTDRIATALTSHSSTRTFAFWLKVNSYTDLMRIFAKHNATEVERLAYEAGLGNLAYTRFRTGTAGQWVINAATISTGTWAHYAVTYDDSATTNNAVWYRNGATISQTNQSPTGTVLTSADPYWWGNRQSDAGRVTNGDLAEMGIWDAILTAAEIKALANGWRASRIRPASLVSYIDAIRDVRDEKAGAPTVTGTAVREHPIFIGDSDILLPNKGAGLRTLTLTADYGSLALSGQTANLLKGSALTAEYGAFALTGQDATLDAQLLTPAPTEYVGAVGRGRRRVWVEIRGGQVYEVADEQEARKVVRAIKRKAVRQIKHAEIGGPLPDLPAIEIRGEAPFVETLKREIGEIEMDMARAYQRLFEAMDEDDVETLLL